MFAALVAGSPAQAQAIDWDAVNTALGREAAGRGETSLPRPPGRRSFVRHKANQMLSRLIVAAVVLAALVVGGTANAQEAPLAIHAPYATRTLTGPNPDSRYVPGDVMRLGVFATRSERPTTVVATHGATEIDVPFYRGPILDDLFDIALPFEPGMEGPWTFTVTRGAETATVETPGMPEPFPLELLRNLRIEEVDGVDTLAWEWPDLAEARRLGLTISTKVRVMQQDNHDEILLNFGLRDHPIPIGAAGEPGSITIPEGLDEGTLFVFRIHLQFFNAADDLVAQSITFVQKPYAA